MTDKSELGSFLTPEEVDVFARGLYHLANVDGIDDREEQLIREFLDEAQSDLSIDDLKASPFLPTEAALMLRATYLRRVFIRAAVALVKADGKYTDRERRAIGEIADAFGMSNSEFGDLEQEAERMSLE
jgi:DnaJ-domain-containing protein 1